MKNGRSLVELAQEIQRQQNAKKDFLVPTTKVKAYAIQNDLELAFAIGTKSGGNTTTSDDFFAGKLTENGHNQLGQFCGIPAKYYDLMRGASAELLAQNVKYWLERSSDRRMIRTLDGNIRALLSDSYRRLDNFDLAQSVLPMLNEVNATIESCEITEKKLYIKAITHKVQAEVKVGELVCAGILVSNSEIGHGALNVKPLVYKYSCANGAIVDALAMRKYHAGRVTELEQIKFSNETLNAEDKAFWLKVRDLVKHSLNEATFKNVVESMQASTKVKIEEPTKAIELVTKKFGFVETEKNDILKHLIEGGDLTSWGLGNAVTRMAQDVPSYDRSTELESIGFEVMQQAWN